MVRRVVLCLNLGSPNEPKAGSIRQYLNSFLDDHRVISLPKIARKLLLWGVILPFRPYKVQKAYQAIWDPKKGSPLIYHSESFAQKLQSFLGPQTQVVLGMRHGNPSWKQAVDKALYSNPDEIIIFPQFPQYASATTGSLVEAVYNYIAQKTVVPNIRLISDFYNHPAYIEALSAQIKPYLTANATLILSYHGLPVRDVQAVDGVSFPCNHEAPCPGIGPTNRYCYRAQCYETSKGIIEALPIDAARVHTTFQSRLGRIPWIKPYTDVYLEQLAERGIKEVVIACPAFTADCLETLEEVGIGLKKQWLSKPGTSFTLVPCLNDTDAWIEAAAAIIAHPVSAHVEPF